MHIRTDATQQEILEAYNKLKNQNANNIEDISLAFEILSSPKKKARSNERVFFNDVCFWQMMTASPNDVCIATHFMANIASLRNEVEQHRIAEKMHHIAIGDASFEIHTP